MSPYTRLDCSAGLFSFRYGRNKLSYCPISSLLLKIRFCQKSVLLIIVVKLISHASPCVFDSDGDCGKGAGGWIIVLPGLGIFVKIGFDFRAVDLFDLIFL